MNNEILQTTDPDVSDQDIFSQIKMEEALPSDNFIRVHKSYIVAIDKIKSVEKNRITIGDAIIPNIELLYREWLFGLSYDINVSDFGRGGSINPPFGNTNGTNNLGGPEFSLIYIIKKVNEEEFCPTCPVYE